MRCPSCGANGPDDARFCANCGAQLQPPLPTPERAEPGTAETGDRRVVTALFADLVDYVRMLAEHDPEVVRTRVIAALATMAEAIERLGGTREKFIGDAVFAVFGWPESHDDDAARAAVAALSLRAALLQPGEGVEPLEVRIGIATGEVVAAGRRPSSDGDLGLTGGAITTAARIQSMARPGEILLDEPTRRAARGRLALDDRGAVVLRGQSTPVHLYALLGEAGLNAWTSYRAAAPGPLVGRERERSRLVAALDRCARTGRGETLVVVGDAGMGKTRLLASLEHAARKHGFAWTWTENVSYGRGEPYRFARLFAQTVADEQGVDSGTLARRLLFTDDVDAATVRRYGGAVAAVARDASFSGWEAEAADTPTDPAEVAEALAEVGERYLHQLMTTAGPRVIVIDDLHWIDRSSVGMVELTVEASARHPLVVLVGTRPGQMPSWGDRADVSIIELDGLSEPETARLATLIARAAVDADDARSIHERTAGNPLFISETVRAALEDGTLAWRDGRVTLVESAISTMPVTLRAVLGARIDALDPTARETLRVASVIGITFGEHLLTALLASAAEPATLQRLANAALVVPADDGAWRFAHPLIHDAAYRGLLSARRRALHARLADELSGRPGAALGEVATHRAAAGDAERALPLLREAAVSATRLGAMTEAAAFWRRAAELSAADAPAEAAIDQAHAEEALAAARASTGGVGLDLA